MGRTVVARFLTLVGIVSAVLLVAVALMALAVEHFEDRAELGRQTEPALRVAQELAMTVTTADHALAAYARGGDGSLLTPYTWARGRIRARGPLLIRATRPTGDAAAAQEAVAGLTAYFDDYADPLVRLARRDPAAARRELAAGEGERRTRALQTQLAVLGERVRSAVRAEARAARRAARVADLFALVALIGGAVVLLLTVRHARREVAVPLGRVSEAADRLGRGDLSVRMPLTGTSEVREVAQAFNRMAERIEQGAGELRARGSELAAARDDAHLLGAVADEMARAATPGERAQVLLERVADLLDAPLGTLYADVEHDGRYRLLAQRGLAVELLPDEMPLVDRVAGKAILERRRLTAEHPPGERQFTAAEGLVDVLHELHFPLEHGGRVVGVLSLGCTTERVFTEQDLERIAAVGEHGAVVLANALESHLRQRGADLQRAVLDAIDDAVLVVDTDDRILMTNPAMERWWGEVMGIAREQDLTIAQVFAQVGERVDEPERLAAWGAEVFADPMYRGSIELGVTGGRTAVAYAAPVLDAGGELIGRIFVSREVTEARQAERAKDELMATVSHELRTPLSAILGFTELLRARDYPAQERAEYLETVHEQAVRLAALVNDFLDLRRLGRPETTLHRAPLDLHELLQEQVALFARQSDRHRIVLDARPGLTIDGDAQALARAVGNLLSNAIKYSPGGGEIRVTAERGGAEAVIVVADEGIGIPDEFKPKVFERFFRVDSSATRRIGGTGLGLPLVKEIAEAHGGSAGFESQEGRGSRFWLLLPAEAPATAGPG